MLYADNVNLLGKNVHTIKRNTDTLLVVGKGVGTDVL
jgi:hypothetical protein